MLASDLRSCLAGFIAAFFVVQFVLPQVLLSNVARGDDINSILPPAPSSSPASSWIALIGEDGAREGESLEEEDGDRRGEEDAHSEELLHHPEGVLATAEAVFVSDTYSHRVLRFSKESRKLERVWPDWEKDYQEQLKFPMGLGYCGGVLGVADTFHDSVVLIDVERGRMKKVDFSVVGMEVEYPKDLVLTCREECSSGGRLGKENISLLRREGDGEEEGKVESPDIFGCVSELLVVHGASRAGVETGQFLTKFFLEIGKILHHDFVFREAHFERKEGGVQEKTSQIASEKNGESMKGNEGNSEKSTGENSYFKGICSVKREQKPIFLSGNDEIIEFFGEEVSEENPGFFEKDLLVNQETVAVLDRDRHGVWIVQILEIFESFNPEKMDEKSAKKFENAHFEVESEKVEELGGGGESVPPLLEIKPNLVGISREELHDLSRFRKVKTIKNRIILEGNLKYPTGICCWTDSRNEKGFSEEHQLFIADKENGRVVKWNLKHFKVFEFFEKLKKKNFFEAHDFGEFGFKILENADVFGKFLVLEEDPETVLQGAQRLKTLMIDDGILDLVEGEEEGGEEGREKKVEKTVETPSDVSCCEGGSLFVSDSSEHLIFQVEGGEVKGTLGAVE